MCFVFDFLVGGGGADCLVFPKLNKYQHSQLQFFMSFFFLLIFFSCLGYLYLPIIFVLFIIYTSCLLYHALIIFILSHLLQNAFVTVSCTIQAGDLCGNNLSTLEVRSACIIPSTSGIHWVFFGLLISIYTFTQAIKQ